MVAQINYNLNANEDFVIILTSKLSTCFIDGFTLGMKSQSIAHLLKESKHIYIYVGFKPWKSNAISMGFLDRWPSRMQG